MTTRILPSAVVLAAIEPCDPDHLHFDAVRGHWSASWIDEATVLELEELRRAPGVEVIDVRTEPLPVTGRPHTVVIFDYDPQAAAADPANAARHTAPTDH